MEVVEETVHACTTLPLDSTKENLSENAFPIGDPEIGNTHKTNGELESLNSIEPSEIPASNDYTVSETVDDNPFKSEEPTFVAEAATDTNQDVNNLSQEVQEGPSDQIGTEPEGTGQEKQTYQTEDETNLITEFIEESSEGKTLNLSNEMVEFETEVLIEEEIPSELTESNNDVTNNILSELDGQNVNLQDELASTETETTENNNTSIKQEVFNNEELLDILEGNDLETAKNEQSAVSSELTEEAKIALQQWRKLKIRQKNPEIKRSRKSIRKTNASDKISVKNSDKQIEAKKRKTGNQPPDHPNENSFLKSDDSNKPRKDTTESQPLQEDANIVTALVKDWEDDDIEDDKSSKQIVASNVAIEIEIDASKQNTGNKEDISKAKKSSENGISQRRLSRVIKKKVIFDPDNPDTFTTGKNSKSKIPEVVSVQAQSTPKKIKTEQSISRDQSKSPVSKMQWKKPTPKNHKRLSEVDKLLMDEGAVNMIYQLTPEASKGKKNMRTKAELIKKINQSSTPEAEKKFRDRKKDVLKSSDAEAKKIPGGKQRSSVSGSAKSVSVGEDFEAHDSIIYRRHSSSSYSSSCMSPLRQDVEAFTGTAPDSASLTIEPKAAGDDTLNGASFDNGEGAETTFIDESADLSTENVIKKEDCLSLKEKLKSRLSTVLNKRKRDTSKSDTSKKQKKIATAPEPTPDALVDDFKTLAISFDCRMAEICIRKVGLRNSAITIEMLKELENALDSVNARKGSTVTLLSAEFPLFSARLELSPLLDDNRERAANYAFELTSAIRTLLLSLERHSKLLVCGVGGACEGLGVAMAAMCDVCCVVETASFALTPHLDAPLMPGAAVLSNYRRLPHSLINEVVLFGGRVPAGEALRLGLASRVLWPPRFADAVRAIAKDVAAQPAQTVLLKKQLLGLRGRADREAFPASLAAEQDLLVDYWTSAEGRELLRAHLARPN